MTSQYPGGFITKSPPATVGPVDGEGGSAPGVWTLDQAMALNKQGLWPKPIIQGGLWSWGANGSGQLGLNNTTSRNSPVQVGALTDWKVVSQGFDFSIGVRADNTIWSWGKNVTGPTAVRGMLGQGDIINRSSPTQIGALTNWESVACGGYHSLAVKTNGTLWAWGRAASGELGNQYTASARLSPVQIGSLTNWKIVSAGSQISFAIKTDGTLWSWGTNTVGALGLSDNTDRSSPVQVGSLTNWKAVAAGGGSVLALKTDGTLWTWGSNSDGALGLNDVTSRNSPVQIGALTTWAKPVRGTQSGAALKSDGTLWTWGRNNNGELGLGDVVYRSSPVQIGALTNWMLASAGQSHMLAIKSDGTLWAWGSGTSGRLGDDDTTNKSSPIQVGALAAWKKLPQMGSSNSSMAIQS